MAREIPESDPLLALQAGDPHPFEAFVRAWSSTLVAYFVHHGSLVNRAEDLTQEVFLKLFRSRARYRPRERFTAYLFRTARNVWIDDCRRTAVRHARLGVRDGSGAVDAPGRHPDPCLALLSKEEERGLEELLDELSTAQRRVFELVLL